MEAMGLPRDAIELVRDLHKGASIRVRTPKGDTASIPIMGRGTIQGDTLSPLLFVIFIDPLLRWLEEGNREYKFETSDAKLGSMAYADDLAIVTDRVAHLHTQAAKVDYFCTWAGLEMNVDEARKNKTAWTGIVRDADAGKKTEMDRAKSNGVRIGRVEDEWMGRKAIPYLNPNESYVHLGAHINPSLNWKKHWETTKEKLRVSANATTQSSALVTQKLHILEAV
eukprot:7023467-Pyramimonas_sp.AAC.2